MNTANGIESLLERRKNYKKRRKVKALKVTNKRCVFSKKGRKNVCDEKEGRGSQHFYPAPISGWVIKLLFKHAAEKSFFEESSERITKESSKEALPEKCPYSELFRSVFFYIGTEYQEILRISPYSSECGKITDRNNSEYGHFLHSEGWESETFSQVVYHEKLDESYEMVSGEKLSFSLFYHFVKKQEYLYNKFSIHLAYVKSMKTWTYLRKESLKKPLMALSKGTHTILSKSIHATHLRRNGWWVMLSWFRWF